MSVAINPFNLDRDKKLDWLSELAYPDGHTTTCAEQQRPEWQKVRFRDLSLKEHWVTLTKA
jgi:hypothetical protein